MKLRNLGIATIILTLVLALSSCTDHDRYYWERGTLARFATVSTDRYGEIYDVFRIDERDLTFRTSPGYDGIRDIRILGNNDKIWLNLRTNGMIDELWISIAGTNVSLPFDRVYGDTPHYGGDIAHFFDVLVEEIYRRGYADIVVEGYSEDAFQNRLDIDIVSDIEVYIRD